jgi:hypothetical protein
MNRGSVMKERKKYEKENQENIKRKGNWKGGKGELKQCNERNNMGRKEGNK